MRKSILYILFYVIVATVFLSCERESENNSASAFYINPPSLNKSNGAKTYWTDEGLWWDIAGNDFIRVNHSDNIRIIRKQIGEEKKWVAEVGTAISTIPVENGYFYVCYTGDGQAGIGFDEETKTFSGVNISGIVPMVGKSDKPYITLTPCCAVLRFINVESGYSVQSIFPEENIFPKNGDISVNNLCIVDSTVTSYFSNADFKASSSNGVVTIVLPMKEDSHDFNQRIVFLATKRQNTSYSIQTRSGITIRRGYVYEIDCSNWTGWTTTQ